MNNTKLLLLILVMLGFASVYPGIDFGPVHVSAPDFDVSGAVHQVEKKAVEAMKASGVAITDTAKLAAKKAIFEILRPLAAGAVTEISESFFLNACNQIKNVITDLHNSGKVNFDMFGSITDDYINLVLNLNRHTRQKSSAMNNALKDLLFFAEQNVLQGQAAPSKWMGVSFLWSLKRAKPMWDKGRVVPSKQRGPKGQTQYGTVKYVNVEKSIYKFRTLNDRNFEYAELLSSLGVKAATIYNKKIYDEKLKEKRDSWKGLKKF